MKKNKVSTGLLILFSTIAVVHIIGIFIQNSTLVYSTKPCIIPLLFLIYMVRKESINRWYIVGLILCFIGDVLLLFNGELFFILGLISFLFAHVFYAKTVYDLFAKIEFKKLIIAAIPYIILYAILLMILYPYLGVLFYPVIIYGIVISIFGTLCFYYFLKCKTSDALYWFLGASFFIVSDSILAINKFYTSSVYLAILVMITYILAQYLLCKALLIRKIG